MCNLCSFGTQTPVQRFQNHVHEFVGLTRFGFASGQVKILNSLGRFFSVESRFMSKMQHGKNRLFLTEET
jgi:hypothetical protein